MSRAQLLESAGTALRLVDRPVPEPGAGQVLPLDEANEALARLRRGELSGAAVLVP